MTTMVTITDWNERMKVTAGRVVSFMLGNEINQRWAQHVKDFDRVDCNSCNVGYKTHGFFQYTSIRDIQIFIEFMVAP